MEFFFLVLCFCFLSLFPQLCELANIDYFLIGSDTVQNNGMFAIGGNLLFYAIWGHLIRRVQFSATQRKIIYLIGLGAMLIHFLGLYLLSIHDGMFNWSFLNYAYPTNVMIAVAVFVWFKHQNWENVITMLHVTPAHLSYVSSCSFGIYLIHRLVHNVGGHFGLPFQNHYYGFILTYLVAFSIIFVMKKLPVINKIVP